MFISSIFCYGEVNQEEQKFEVIYTITYNSITLREAARIENQIKKDYKDACSVKLECKKVSDTITTATITIGDPYQGYIELDDSSVQC
jgi:hypothetical protein